LKSLEPHQYKLSCRAFLPEKTAGKILIGIFRHLQDSFVNTIF